METGAKPPDAPAFLPRQSEQASEVGEWRKIADVVAESMENRNKRDGDAPSRINHMRRFGAGLRSIQPHIYCGVSGKELAAAAKSAPIGQKHYYGKERMAYPPNLGNASINGAN